MSSAQDQTRDIIDLIWDREKYYIVSACESAPSREDLLAFAARYGVTFPEDYLAHASNYFGGLYLVVNEEIWPRHKAGDVGPFWSFLYGVFTHALSDEAPEWMQLGPVAEEFREMGHQVVPFLKIIGDADVYCFDANGSIQRWLHEEDAFEPYEGGFFDLLRQEFLELDERRKRKEAGGETSP
ncbi:SMI1/KNR4 family protein [Luteolibacter flavescens]|uniref:SMI1/KNR4 family protein n=1 Tax=Luteolibacter flavescens TaxID=1859460 RepID=A0ABT3FS09_9BACT|nr:SMI1/KNR4 family protein [Luteolibacter flavescens]MCW1886378.1 SMI1/KNR4 family protein [Luteolibacter flavescens]